jgi:NADH-quinone oxidoreductase subunit L
MVMLPLIPLLPFAGFLVNAVVGRRLTKTASGAVACLAVGGSFLVSAAAVWTLVSGPATALEYTAFTWFSSHTLQVPFAFRLDQLSALMILVVTGIGTLIHVYSVGYMHDEAPSEYARYFSYLNLFAAFMLVLVLGANFPVMFVGWEGVGLCSYLLIGFWFTKTVGGRRGQEGVRRQPCRRLRLHPGDAARLRDLSARSTSRRWLRARRHARRRTPSAS